MLRISKNAFEFKKKFEYWKNSKFPRNLFKCWRLKIVTLKTQVVCINHGINTRRFCCNLKDFFEIRDVNLGDFKRLFSIIHWCWHLMVMFCGNKLKFWRCYSIFMHENFWGFKIFLGKTLKTFKHWPNSSQADNILRTKRPSLGCQSKYNVRCVISSFLVLIGQKAISSRGGF